MRSRAVAVALVVLVAAPSVVAGAQNETNAPTTNTTVPEVRRQREIEERIRELREAVGEASAEEGELLGQLSDTQAALDARDAAIDRIDGELASANARLDQAEGEVLRLEGRYVALTGKLRETNRAIDEVRDDVADVTGELYRRAGGQRAAAFTALALEAGTPHELFAGRQYLSVAAENDEAQIDRLVKLKDRVEFVRSGLEDEREAARAARDVVASERARIAGLKREQERARAEIADAVARQEDLLERVHAEKDRFNAEIATLTAESNSIASLLRGHQSGQVFVGSGSGLLGVPVAARLTSRFGPRLHPILGTSRMHNGVDFGAGYGTPVVAAGDGDVVWAGGRGGYGNTVIVDHGNTLATLYAHLSNVRVGVGQHVTRGQVVGAVGSTGLSTGPHLHFEVRRSGTPVDPLGYL